MSVFIQALMAHFVSKIEFDEDKLKEFGKEMGRNIVLMYNLPISSFSNNFPFNLGEILYFLIYTYIPKVFDGDETVKRSIDKRDNVYYIVEHKSYFMKHLKTKEEETFTMDTFFAGIYEFLLESIIRRMNKTKLIDNKKYSVKIVAHNQIGTNGNKTVYEINVKSV